MISIRNRFWRLGAGRNPPQVPVPRTSHASDDKQAEARASRRAALEKVQSLSKPVGALLVVAGVVVMPLPGPMGMPLVIAGGLVLAPRTFGKFENFLERRCPELHRAGWEAAERFASDYRRRFPEKATT